MKEYIKDIPKANKPRKILAMLIHFGELKNGKTCKECCHLKKYGWRGKNYYKLECLNITGQLRSIGTNNRQRTLRTCYITSHR